jgi:type III pantothenate kinase
LVVKQEQAVIDIGNSRTKVGWFRNGQLLRSYSYAGVPWAEISTVLTNPVPDNIIYSSVGPVAPTAWRAELEAGGSRVWELSSALRLPFSNHYETPATLGKDRLAAVAGARALYPGESCLVIDAGTCITADLLTADGSYLGGNISPGIRMRLRAMHEGTARLPLVEPTAWDGKPGRTTAAALVAGGAGGAALEIEGLQQRWATDYPRLRVLLTGGDALLLADMIKSRIFVHPNLVLYGLDQILRYNV